MKKKIDRLQIIFILLACYLQALFFGKANKKPQKISKILIIQTGKLGDMVCITPMFNAIKQKYPQSELWIMGNKINQELLSGHPLINHYITFDFKPIENLKILKQNNFSFAVSVFPDFNALATMILANIKYIAVPKIIDGFCPQNTKSYQLLSKFVLTKPDSIKEYAPRFYLKLLEPIDIFTDDTKKYLTYSNPANQKITKYLQDKKINLNQDFLICLAPSVGNKMKLWPADRFANVINYIYNNYQTKIILIGHGNDKEQIDSLIDKLNSRVNFINTYNLFNLDELKALISKMNLFISVDTGTIYLAEAFAIPTIDLVGALDENCQPPNGPLNKIVKGPREKPATCILNVRVVDIEQVRKQVLDMTDEMLIEKFEELVKILNLKKK